MSLSDIFNILLYLNATEWNIGWEQWLSIAGFNRMPVEMSI